MEELPVIFGVVFPRQRGKETVPGQPPHRPTLGTSARAKGVGATTARSLLAGVGEPNVFRGRAGSRRSAILSPNE